MNRCKVNGSWGITWPSPPVFFILQEIEVQVNLATIITAHAFVVICSSAIHRLSLIHLQCPSHRHSQSPARAICAPQH